VEQHHRRTDND
nr:Chain P, Envelope glycoprotein peptide [synthetic construct]